MKVEYIIIHHTGAEEKDAEQVRRYHLSLGWRDVGYNYIIERDGRVVAGRSLAIPGAHCRDAGMNFKSAGMAVSRRGNPGGFYLLTVSLAHFWMDQSGTIGNRQGNLE
ncbi:N-acetylmuramoyl-L-alanine amidase [Moorella sp. Hama-1]|uniref:N-acetylmuramoyl-L-alanine amidase n=1 Tax=Moorella sp. Hama-1 TaxID=2138101 RepID=UPI000D64C36D|nr:N-acetylmuramoyl-L-alanine amidase [Moorella sp. Hama-1]BCV21898.1 hypothetical protein hamaS1_19670 [Moorella sp. Hama-1]